MWTGENSLKSIQTYTSGYYAALLDNNLATEIMAQDPFHNWVAKKLGYFESTAGWPNMILANTVGCQPSDIDWEQFFKRSVSPEEHSGSIKLFYQLIRQFKQETEAGKII